MSSPMVATQPCLPVEREHVAEARRALAAQRPHEDPPDDEAIERTLWLARALPLVLDVLSDPRARRSLTDVHLGLRSVDFAGEHDGSGCRVVVIHTPLTDTLEVRIVDVSTLGAGAPEEAEPFVVLVLELGDDAPRVVDRSGVQIQRFVHGKGKH